VLLLKTPFLPNICKKEDVNKNNPNHNTTIMKFNRFFLFAIIGFAFMIASCSSNKEPERKFVRNPVDDLIRDMSSEKNYSIILFDMDEKDKKYTHKYKILVEKKVTASLETEPKVLRGSMSGLLAQANASTESNAVGTPEAADSVLTTGPAEIELKETTTDWTEVSEDFFYKNIDNMGMEIASSTDGVVSKVPSPPGYDKYVGNEKYGQWRTNSSGGSFWHFYGQYMFMRYMFMGSPISRGGYQDYGRNYKGKQPYYGKTAQGGAKYGTNSAASKKKNPDFFKRRQANKTLTKSAATAHKAKAATRATKSTKSTGTRSSRTTRSTSRTGSSSRSRGGGFGK